MNKIAVHVPAIHLIGIKQRTNNLQESNSATAKIAATVQRYFQTALMEKIPQRVSPGTTYSVYTEYASDVNGDYTYFIGEKVTALQDIPDGLVGLTIPAQNYMLFTSHPGPMPAVCIDLWQKIWALNPAQLGGERQYLADFELYDKRAIDPQNTVLDIYIGIKQ